MGSKKTVSASGSGRSRARSQVVEPSAPESAQTPPMSSLPSSEGQLRTNDFDAVAQITELMAGNAPEDASQARSEPTERQTDESGQDIPEETQDSPEGSESFDHDIDVDGEESGEVEVSSSPSSPGSLSDLAEKLDVSPEELYNVEVTTGDGEAVTLGQLKDAWQDREARALETEERSATIDQRETAVAVDQQILARLAQDMRHTLTPQQIDGIGQLTLRRDQQLKAEMFAAMPELKDENSRTVFEEQTADLLREYNVPPHQMRVEHAGMVVMIRDFMRMRDQVSKLKKYKPTAKATRAAKSQGRGANTGKSARDRAIEAARGGTTEQQVSAVSSLLGN